ncbi:hypothetical protein HPP92_006873 [Vanilla planifolia]|uniref:O-fucosyltransferase family protein n=1 Tax=Vanilla planifolia TaxID=51239 RepID=A0A835RD14_VANPL|nr:hypothetical protein HPP92_006873 [Vanilla planifolia]
MPFHRRRNRLLPVLPKKSAVVAAAAVLLLFIACLSLFTPHVDVDSYSPSEPFHRIRHRPIRSFRDLELELSPGEMNNSFTELTRAASDVSVFIVPSEGEKTKNGLWSSKLSEYYYGCSNGSNKFAAAQGVTHPNRYLMIATSGGLNQQRTGITDAVVAARILNATLVVPKLDQRSFWKDSSDFSEIFDVDWFISFLSKDVKIVKQLPRIGKDIRGPYTMRVPRKCNPRCYQTRVLPVILKKHVVQLTKFDYRLSNRLETDLQKLRCRVNYHALRFTDPIQRLGSTLIRRMRAKSEHFIALHLRFEPDMLAFSGCYYGGGDKERKELGAIRRRWKTLHKNNPDKERRQGKCPLTPEEVGLMLRALGFGMDVHLYVASGEVYGGEAKLAPLKAMFPNFHSKETLASKEELTPFYPFSSRMAAIDFIVCDGSDAFVTNNNGNMAKIIAGRRRYYNHQRTIRPNAKKLYSLFLNRCNMTWDSFAAKVRKYQRGFMGEPKELRPGRGEFHENPSTCICENMQGTSRDSPVLEKLVVSRDPDEAEQEIEESEEPDMDDEDDTLLLKDTLDDNSSADDDSLARPEEQELEEMLSD